MGFNSGFKRLIMKPGRDGLSCCHALHVTLALLLLLFVNVRRNIRGKSEVVPVHAMKAYGGRRSIAPLILSFGPR